MVKKLRELSYKPTAGLDFGTSGLRGKVSDMTDLECYINTKGFISFLYKTKNIKKGATIALAGDLRNSTPRILQAVARGIWDSGCKVEYLGKIPTPAAAYYAFQYDIALAMVTGSHIPADRNGIKFYKRGSEVLKSDESEIKKSIATIRQSIYSRNFSESDFDKSGRLLQNRKLPTVNTSAVNSYIKRYTDLFPNAPLKNKTVVVYQHSSVAADILIDVLSQLGATTIPVGRSYKFIPIDTENVTHKNRKYFKSLARKYPNTFAIISADGDADRPFVVDENGNFQRGDIVGAVTANFLSAKESVVSISSSDAVDKYLTSQGIKVIHCKIGSPYVIERMTRAQHKPVVGWEANGGFLTGSSIKLNTRILAPLLTRDAVLPIVCTLIAAIRERVKVSEFFANLPQRFTQSGLIDNFPTEVSKAILRIYAQNPKNLQKFFKQEDGFGKIININTLDGLRIFFDNGDIAHIRPSGNAPQLRIYSVADTQRRANEIVKLAIAEPKGLLRRLEASI